jgi:hypothetical protein
MALCRQRALSECLDLADSVEDKELAAMLREKFSGWHGLVNELEAP